jgi:hypothetical protein
LRKSSVMPTAPLYWWNRKIPKRPCNWLDKAHYERDGHNINHPLDLNFLVQFDQPPQVKTADDLADVMWVTRNDVEYEKIAFDSLRRAVR